MKIMTKHYFTKSFYLLAPLFALSAWLANPALARPLGVFQLTVHNGRFTPTKIIVPAGQKFKLLVKNTGAVPEEFESVELNRERVVAQGQTITIYLGPLDAGNYSFVGDFHPATAKGTIIAK